MWATTNKMILGVEKNTYPGGQGYFLVVGVVVVAYFKLEVCENKESAK